MITNIFAFCRKILASGVYESGRPSRWALPRSSLVFDIYDDICSEIRNFNYHQHLFDLTSIYTFTLRIGQGQNKQG